MITSFFSRMPAMLFVVTLLAVSGASAEQSVDEKKLALSERLVELQRLDAFFQAEWDFQMQQMEEAMADQPDVEIGIPEGYMEALRQQQVEGQVNDWVEAWALAFDKERLRELINYLERPDSQAWVADQLEAYPYFLDALATRAEAMVDVFQEDQAQLSEADAKPAMPLSELPPVVDSALADLLEFAPGARIEASLDTTWFEAARVPASHPVINQVFADLRIELTPDGDEAARVAQVSSERAYPDEEACEVARARLEETLADYFPDSEMTDCGHVRHMAAGGDIRMTLRCRDQEVVGNSKLSLVVSHKPTNDSAHERFMAEMDSKASEAEQRGDSVSDGAME